MFLRPLVAEDISDVYLDGLNNPDIIQYTEARHRQWDKANCKEFIESAQNETSILFGVFLKQHETNIGNIRLFNKSRHRHAELSFLFFDQNEWGKGFATEALNAVISFGHQEWNLHKIHADYYSVNKRSARVFEKLGFKITGKFTDHFILNDRFIDSIRVEKILGDKVHA